MGLGEERAGGDLIFGGDGAMDCAGGLALELGGVLLFMLRSSSPLLPFTGLSPSSPFGLEDGGLNTLSRFSGAIGRGGIPGMWGAIIASLVGGR
jgi:hypothetical protein